MSSDKNDTEGLFAFPSDFNDDVRGWYQRGMTLRDWFAGQALAGIASMENIYSTVPEDAKLAYRYADAMMKAREGRDG